MQSPWAAVDHLLRELGSLRNEARALTPDASGSVAAEVVLTGHVLDNARRRALDAGADEFCTKPCLPADLAAAVKRHLPRK